jgi:hypothetical protein
MLQSIQYTQTSQFQTFISSDNPNITQNPKRKYNLQLSMKVEIIRLILKKDTEYTAHNNKKLK